MVLGRYVAPYGTDLPRHGCPHRDGPRSKGRRLESAQCSKILIGWLFQHPVPFDSLVWQGLG